MILLKIPSFTLLLHKVYCRNNKNKLFGLFTERGLMNCKDNPQENIPKSEKMFRNILKIQDNFSFTEVENSITFQLKIQLTCEYDSRGKIIHNKYYL